MRLGIDMNMRQLQVLRRMGAALAALLLVVSHIARAQTGVVAGNVVAQGTQRPLAEAEVGVRGVAGKGSVTDGSGRFRITGLTGTTVILEVRLIGYRPVTDTVKVGATNLTIALSESLIELNKMVVTGTAGGAQVRELGTAVSQLNIADIETLQPVPTVEGLLNGRAPGVDVIATSGQVGAGAQIRVRGIGTFSLSSTPLIYVDGIRVDNGQTGIVSRFNDIDPSEIASMEVLKGPAAATLYGTEAARGVINIITKKGDAGAPVYTFTEQSGQQWFQNAVGRMPTNYWLDPKNDSLWSTNAVKSEAAYGTPLFRTGLINNYNVSAAGGAGVYRYFVSGSWNDANGIVITNARLQKNLRTNLSIVPSSKVHIETSLGYITSQTNVAAEGGGNSAIWGEFNEPQRLSAACPVLYNPIPVGCGWSRGFISSPPNVADATQNWQNLQRVTASASLRYDPFPWMSHRLLFGIDYTLEDINAYLPYQTNDTIVFFTGTRFDGSRSETTQQTLYDTYDYVGSVHFNLKPDLLSTTSLGVQYYTNQQTALTASGTHFPSPGLSTISATGTKGSPTSSLTAENTLGAYLQQEFGLGQRLFVTGAVRVDNNSAFGSKASFTTYPKVSASWVASDEPGIRSFLPTFVDDFRFRAAFGGSGQQPLTNSALQTLAPVAGPNGSTTLTTSTLGNPLLKPERVLGTELGFESSLLQGRVGIDLTLFSDVTNDAILATTVAPSTGYGGSTQYVNAGKITKHGLELALRGQIIDHRDYGWDTQFNIAGTTSKIIRIGAGADTIINVTGGATVVGTVGDVYQRVGYSPFDLFTYRVLSSTINSAGKATNIMCDNGAGGAIPCFVPGTSTIQAPLIYFGHSVPTTTGSWANTFRYKRFRLYVMVDWQAGFRKTNTNTEQVCQVFGDCLQSIYPQNYSSAVVATAQNGSEQLQDYFINSASFAKLREVSISYEAPSKVAAMIGAKDFGLTLAGHNLAMLTKYTGLDPESSIAPSTGGSSSNIGTDQTEYPQLASWVLTIRLKY
jgi:TonB-linked SusC/RagA family outer membrane protein